jgi:RNA polymerase sigma-70 factor (ECF subfamily)
MAVEPESRLLTRAANGETDAFRELFEAHHAAMFRFAYRLTGTVDAAEDITQECFLRLMRSPGFDHERGSLRQYLYGIVRNLVRQRRQANGREVYWDDDEVEDDLKSAVAACLDPMASAELTAVVQAAISGLPPLQREAIVLFEFEELSLEETAAVVGSDVGTIKSRLHRAREGLRRSLAPYRSHVQVPLPKGTTL